MFLITKFIMKGFVSDYQIYHERFCFWLPNLSWKGVVSDYQIYHERFCFWLPNLSWKGFVSDYQIYHEREGFFAWLTIFLNWKHVTTICTLKWTFLQVTSDTSLVTWRNVLYRKDFICLFENPVNWWLVNGVRLDHQSATCLLCTRQQLTYIQGNSPSIVCQNWPETYEYSMTFHSVFVNLRK